MILLIALSAAAAIYVSLLIARRQDLPSAARRAFLYSNVSLIFCLAAAIAGISVHGHAPVWGNSLLLLAAFFLVLKFVFVRRFAHLIGSGRARTSNPAVVRALSKKT